MSKAQRTIVWIAAAMLVVLMLFPPWRFDLRHKMTGEAAGSVPAGYAFLLSPPVYERQQPKAEWGSPAMDLQRLTMSIIAVVVIAGIAVHAYAPRRRP